ncbi:MAG: iron ABC transporter permease [Firmicutes bacterium]|nr:iron ABC transporter permease [Bacillota bacterium]
MRVLIRMELLDHWRLRLKRLLSWQNLGIGFLLAMLAYLILIPIGMIIWGSFRDAPPGVEGGGYTLAKYVYAYGNPNFYQVALNTTFFAVGATLLALVAGTFLAWITERTNTPWRGLIYVLVMFPIIIPGIFHTIAWVLILSPSAGLINKAGVLWLGREGPILDVFSLPGMIWVQGTDVMGISFLLMAAAFRTMDPVMEESAQTSGANLWYTLRTVTLPLLLPAILATTLLVFIRNIEAFEVPAVLGIPAGYPAFSTLIWVTVSTIPRDLNLSAAFSMTYLLVSSAGLYLYYRATSLKERFTTITGKGYRPTRINLGRTRYIIAIIATAFLFLSVGLPLLVLLYTSFLPYFQFPGQEAFDRLTLSQYKWILEASMVRRATINNLIVGTGSALAAVFAAAAISWVIIRTRMRGRKLLDALAFAPIAFPGMVMGVALIWVYLTFPIGVYGTLWILFLGFFTKYLCIAMRATHASMTQVHQELIEASEVSGASWPRTFFQVIVPLILPGMLVGFIYVLSLTFKVLGLPILIGHTRTQMLAVAIWDLYENGSFSKISALAILMFIFLVSLAAIARAVASRFGVKQSQS